ncbi:hypothetical protein HYN48_09655 [Flavobacterium magnum]|uniref:Uncharacterized protein n=1 Tax=Flavobacterium magnum TaxID=2162713 RepID=A0A2S0RGA7_9FLAO|nr:hypothetical protein [Flavobacterium magnum]AWA30330.1 hypothetical protein HYN48_09655 [Flavobacterium magnum]
MKYLLSILFLVPAIVLAQPRYSETRVTQLTRPDHDSASHRVVTTTLLRVANSKEWIPIYTHDTLVRKYRDTGKAKLRELSLAKAVGKKYLEDATAAERNTNLPVLGTDVPR